VRNDLPLNADTSRLVNRKHSRSAAVIPFAGLLTVLLLVGCNGGVSGEAIKPSGSGTPSAATDAKSTPVQAAALAKRPAFDGEKAYALLKKQCDFGPRPVGSEAHRKTRDYLLEEMRKYADKTSTQDFTYRGMPLSNIVGVFNPEAKKQILLCAHWDTRPRADMEIDDVKRKQPIIGASDGASGVAVLLELARMFKQQKPDVGVVVVLLDGEDYGFFERDEGVLLGAKYLARNHKEFNFTYGILLDMVGDKDLDIYRETNSQRYAHEANDKFFKAAADLGFGKFIIDDEKTNVTDDHMPLNIAGIRTIDIIDFNYKHWHTLDDTADKCSADSLKKVGETTAEVVYREH